MEEKKPPGGMFAGRPFQGPFTTVPWAFFDALRRLDLQPDESMLLLLLARRQFSADQLPFESVGSLAATLNRSRAHVFRLLERLSDPDRPALIRRVSRYEDGTGIQRSSCYDLSPLIVAIGMAGASQQNLFGPILEGEGLRLRPRGSQAETGEGLRLRRGGSQAETHNKIPRIKIPFNNASAPEESVPPRSGTGEKTQFGFAFGEGIDRESVLNGGADDRRSTQNAADKGLHELIWRCWADAVGVDGSPTPEGLRAIRRRLAGGYLPSQVLKASEGVAWDGLAMGRHPKSFGQHCDLPYVLGNRIDHFMGLWRDGRRPEPPRRPTQLVELEEPDLEAIFEEIGLADEEPETELRLISKGGGDDV